LVTRGYHVFADGAAVPNPGAGGWGFVAYQDGEEVWSDCGGEPETTNNRMEIAAVLEAILWSCQYPTLAITIWSDSQYTCNGVNDWRHGWKAKGWQRGGPDAKPENRILLNADLWRAIDEALCDPRAANIKIYWVKGHAGHVGNERADELAEIGRQTYAEVVQLLEQDLDAEYRAMMAG
jgi:ribonuclease HI